MGDIARFICGGLRNEGDRGHVNVAIQALFHCHEFVKLLVQDDVHRNEQCLSSKKCVICTLYLVLKEMVEGNIADSSSILERWNDLSIYMDVNMRRNPLEVLHMFLTKMRLELFLRLNPQSQTAENLHTSPVCKMFEGQLHGTANCPSCGEYPFRNYFFYLNICEVDKDSIHKSIMKSVGKFGMQLCQHCCQLNAKLTPSTISFPPFLILHIKRTVSDVTMQPFIELGKETYSFQACIVRKHVDEEVSLCQFYGKGKDGIIRQFEDSKFSPTKLMTLFSSDVLKSADTTIIYAREKKKDMKVTTMKAAHHPNKKEAGGYKVMSYPKDDVDLMDGLPTHRTIGTQTCGTNADVAIQVNIREPLVSYEKYKNCKKFKFFTGICKEDFEALFNLLGGDECIRGLKLNYSLNTPKKLRQSLISSRDRLFMFLLRLRRGLPLEELSFIFQLSVPYVGELCYVMTRLVFLTLKALEEHMFPTAAAQKKMRPKVMKPFPDLRIILDGASFFIQQPSNFEHQGNTNSSYKGANVILIVLGISCEGGTIFCSVGMEGSMSDKQAVLQSGLLQRLDKGDGVMVDRGFDLAAEIQGIGGRLYKPPSKGARDALTAEEELLTKAIAASRIYSEHAIADMKDNRLLQGVIPLTLLPVLSDLIYTAAVLRNFSACRINNKKVVVKKKSSDK